MYISFLQLDTRGPQPPGRGPAVVRAWPVRNRAAQQEVSSGQAAKLHLPLPIARITAWTIPPNPLPRLPWKNYLPRNQSLVPKRLGTAELDYIFFAGRESIPYLFSSQFLAWLPGIQEKLNEHLIHYIMRKHFIPCLLPFWVVFPFALCFSVGKISELHIGITSVDPSGVFLCTHTKGSFIGFTPSFTPCHHPDGFRGTKWHTERMLCRNCLKWL